MISLGFLVQKKKKTLFFGKIFSTIFWDGIIRMPLDFSSRVEVNWIMLIQKEKLRVKWQNTELILYSISMWWSFAYLHICTLKLKTTMQSFHRFFFFGYFFWRGKEAKGK